MEQMRQFTERERMIYRDMIVITSRELVKGDFLEQLEKVLKLSPRALILREKDLDDTAYEELARSVMALCREAEVPCFLHSRLELAKRLGCRSLHLPFQQFMELRKQGSDLSTQEIMAAEKSKESSLQGANYAEQSFSEERGNSQLDSSEQLPAEAGLHPLKQFCDQISVSCHSLSEAKEASEAGADQIVLGTIFETSCKPGRKGRGTAFVREVCEAVSIPVYAIGGVSVNNLPDLKEAGAAGGCMMSGFMQLSF